MIHLKMIFRSWWRNKLSTAISIISLTIGIVCSSVLILFVLGEYKIATSLGDTDHIYLVENIDAFEENDNVRTNNTSPNLGFNLKERYAEVESFVTFKKCNWRFSDTKKSIKDRYLYAVNEELCGMLEIPVLEGNLRSTLKSEYEIAVTNSFMLELYGRPAKIGDIITAESGGETEGKINGIALPELKHEVTVTTILDESSKTPLHYGALTKIPIKDVSEKRNAIFNDFINLIKLTPKSSISDLETKVASDSLYKEKYNKPFFFPLSDAYLDGRVHGQYGAKLIVTRDASLLTVSMSVALAILVIAMFNYINITMTRARARLKNIAGQRIFGASKWSVRWQTMLDTSLLVLLTFGLSIAIINTVLPRFNSFMECNISLGDILVPMNMAILAGLLMLIIALSSIYILVRIEVSNPINSFKNPMGSKSSISSIMVIAQFVISIVLIVVSINISRQMSFIVSQRAVASTILEISIPTSSDYDELPKDFTDQVISTPGVESYSWSSTMPGCSNSNDGVVTNGMYGDHGIVDFYEMELIEGRTFADGESSGNVVVNETLVKNQGIKGSALGHEFNFNGDDRKIIGVVKDFMYSDAHKAIQSLVVVNEKWGEDILCIKVRGNMDSKISEIRDLWKKLHPNDPPVEMRVMKQIYEDMHTQEMRLKKTIEVFTFISMILTALGLFGLAFYTVGRRSKEIAVRKIHGSTNAQIIFRLCGIFSRWVVIAFVISIPAAYYLSREWLSSFVYRVNIEAWVFFATIGIAVAITFLTVIYQTWSAANANPADSIKSE